MLSTVRSELTKIVTLPSIWVATAIPLALFLLMQTSIFSDSRALVARVGADGFADLDGRSVHAATEITQLLGVSVFNAGLLLPVLGALIAGTEFRGGQLGLTFVAVPDRTRLVLGKALATALYALALTFVCVLIGSVLTYVAVADWDPGLLWSPQMLAAHTRLLLFTVTITLWGLALTLIARRALTGIVASVVVMMLTMAQVVAMISPSLDALLPLSAARNLLLQGRDAGAPLTGSVGQGAVVLAAWAVVTLVVAGAALRRRDAR